VGDHVFLKSEGQKKFPEVGELFKAGNTLFWTI